MMPADLGHFKNQVFIYDGPGVSPKSLAQTDAALRAALNAKYQIAAISSKEIGQGRLEKDAALLVIPGGADIPYTRTLNGAGNKKIRSYVENGGAFLGICAGAYFGGAWVDFAKETPLEVIGARELAFYPGKVDGPVFGPYDYQSERGARAASIVWRNDAGLEKDEAFAVYYNGGGSFVGAKTIPETTVLAEYAETNKPAIIECSVGSGKAILSGVHIEYDPDLMDGTDIYLQTIIPQIKQSNPLRLKLIKHLLERLGLSI